jgi:hypothetical protein
MKSLDQIFNDHGTDKGSINGDKHNYSPVYNTLFSPLRLANIKILEVGIYKGASLESWHEYFPNAIIHAAERDPHSSLDRFKNWDRIKIHLGSAEQPTLIPENNFNIIIDDSDHQLETQVRLMQALWPKLAVGGFYIIEDLFVGELPWGGMGCWPKNRAYLQYSGHASGNDGDYLPKHPQDINFLSRRDLPPDINKILDENNHFFTITSIGKYGGLHMMLVITKA